ncbi:uncharacterized protein LOC143793925 [Ranitomeya variabilis]|uniref:uncharacterized protein LOC143793925 n=1 Tax=Ranitomeya variabilis TaxID=490064 RepID=UPI00405675DB
MGPAGVSATQKELLFLQENQTRIMSFLKNMESPLVSLQSADPGIAPQLAALQQELGQQRDTQAHILNFMASVNDRLLSLQNIASVPTPASAPQPSPRLARPPRYGGDPKSCRGFLNQCQLHFELSPLLFPTDRAKVAFVVSHLEGEALAWVNPLWERDDPLVSQLNLFLDTFRKVFDEPGHLVSTTESLFNLHQGTLSVAQYAIRFRTLSSDLGWNNEALVGAFGVVCLHRLRMSWRDGTLPPLWMILSPWLYASICAFRSALVSSSERGDRFARLLPHLGLLLLPKLHRLSLHHLPNPCSSIASSLPSNAARKDSHKVYAFIVAAPRISYAPVLRSRSRETPPPRTGKRGLPRWL